MKRLIVIILLCYVCLNALAQKVNSNNASPISKETAMGFKNLNAVLGIPSAYEVENYAVIYNLVDTPESHRELRTRISTQDISYLFRGTVSGDVVIFTKILLKKGDREIKLEDKVYIIK